MNRVMDRFFRSFWDDDFFTDWWFPSSSRLEASLTGGPGSQSGGGPLATTTTGPSSAPGRWLTPFGNTSSGSGGMGRIRLDVTETPEVYQVKAELPGIVKEDIKITAEGNVLSIQGEKKQEQRQETDMVHMYERAYGRFQRSIRLPENCNLEDAKTNYQNGVLELTFSKKEPSYRKTIPL